jgi:hypothetical protein
VSQSTSTPPTGFQNFMRVQRTNGSSNTGIPQIAQSLETSSSIPLQGKQVTISFWARAGANYSAASNTFNWRIYGGTGTNQNVFSYTGQTIVVDQSVVLTTSWQRFTHTTSALASYNEYALFFFSTPTGTAGSNDFFDITGVQLEDNTQSTSFEQRQYGLELSLCQRYYTSLTDPTMRGVFGGATNINRLGTILPVTMRIAPVVSLSGSISIYDGSTTGTITSLSVTYSTVNSIEMDAPAATGSFTVGRPVIAYINTGAKINCESEM